MGPARRTHRPGWAVLAVTLGLILIVAFSILCVRVVNGGSDDAGDAEDVAAVEGVVSSAAGSVATSSASSISDRDDGCDSGVDGAESPSGAECPLTVRSTDPVTVTHGPRGVSWTFRSEEETKLLVADLLGQLESGGYGLDRSMTLDLYGQAWGCVAHRASQVLIVQVVPEDLVVQSGGTHLVTVAMMEAEDQTS